MKSCTADIVIATWYRLSKRTCKSSPIISDVIQPYHLPFAQCLHNKLLTTPSSSVVLIFLALLWNTFALAADISTMDLKTVDIKNTIDKRTDLTPEQWRMLIFFARDTNPDLDSKYGHAYVAAVRYRDDIQGFVTDSVFGLYPYKGKDWKLDFIDLDGSVDIKAADKYPEIALFVWVNTSAYQQALSAREKWSKRGKWNLIYPNCVSLLDDIANIAGLKRVDHLGKKPYEFVNELTKANVN